MVNTYASIFDSANGGFPLSIIRVDAELALTLDELPCSTPKTLDWLSLA